MIENFQEIAILEFFDFRWKPYVPNNTIYHVMPMVRFFNKSSEINELKITFFPNLPEFSLVNYPVGI